jgi:hypothetical protein
MLKIAVERENAMMMMMISMEKKVKYIIEYFVSTYLPYLCSSITLHLKIAFPIEIILFYLNIISVASFVDRIASHKIIYGN